MHSKLTPVQMNGVRHLHPHHARAVDDLPDLRRSGAPPSLRAWCRASRRCGRRAATLRVEIPASRAGTGWLATPPTVNRTSRAARANETKTLRAALTWTLSSDSREPFGTDACGMPMPRPLARPLPMPRPMPIPMIPIASTALDGKGSLRNSRRSAHVATGQIENDLGTLSGSQRQVGLLDRALKQPAVSRYHRQGCAIAPCQLVDPRVGPIEQTQAIGARGQRQ